MQDHLRCLAVMLSHLKINNETVSIFKDIKDITQHTIAVFVWSVWVLASALGACTERRRFSPGKYMFGGEVKCLVAKCVLI